MTEIPLARAQWMRERIGELEADNARLRAEIDQIQADHHVVHVKASHLQQAMEVCRDEEPGTILRETDERQRDYVLGEDRTWTAR
jgi:predicted nuclease with TOPRIM domain